MTLINVIILGVIEGFTEFLPISSTAHLVLVSRVLGLEFNTFQKTFEISIQLGAILSVVFLYWKVLVLNEELIKKVLFAFLPTAVIGFIFYDLVKNVFLGNPLISIYALLVGGVFMILFEYLNKKPEVDDFSKLTYKKSFIIGVAQSLSIIPGVSRAAATIIGGLALGLNRKTVVEFSFLLAIPTMGAATGYDLLKNASSFSVSDIGILATGLIVSFVVAWLSISFLLKYIKNHNFVAFGIYRIVIALIFLFSLI